MGRGPRDTKAQQNSGPALRSKKFDNHSASRVEELTQVGQLNDGDNGEPDRDTDLDLMSKPEDCLPGVEAAAAELAAALQDGQRVAIFSDYDPDGTCGAAIMRLGLGSYHEQALFGFADSSDGFGLTRSFIEEARDAGATTLITVDCGSSNSDEVAFAQSLGMRVIVTDHHSVFENTADYHLNPNLTGPRSELSGSGVAFQLAIETRKAISEESGDQFLSRAGWLAGFGTRSDMMDLDDPDNKILVALNGIHEHAPPGIVELAEQMELKSLAKTNQMKLATVMNLSKRTQLVSTDDIAEILFAETQADAEAACRRVLGARDKSKELASQMREIEIDNTVADGRRFVYGISDNEEYEIVAGYSGLHAQGLCFGTKKPSAIFTRAGTDADGETIFKWSSRDLAEGSDEREEQGGLLQILPEIREASSVMDHNKDLRPNAGGHPKAVSGRCRASQIPGLVKIFETWADGHNIEPFIAEEESSEDSSEDN